jgi:hypothetical protein
LNVGVIEGGAIVYAAEATELAAMPGITAIAIRVSVLETAIGPEYTAEVVVGDVPSVV